MKAQFTHAIPSWQGQLGLLASVALLVLMFAVVAFAGVQTVRAMQGVKSRKRALENARRYAARYGSRSQVQGPGYVASAALVRLPDVVAGRIDACDRRAIASRIKRPRSHYGWQYPFLGR